jgi:hypothetical protein
MPLPLLPSALLGSAAIGGITSLLSGRSASNAQDRASQEAREAAQRSEAFEREIINRQLMQSAPYADAGYGALNDLATAYGQDQPKGFNPYSQLGKEGGFTDPSGASQPQGGVTGWDQLLKLLPALGGAVDPNVKTRMKHGAIPQYFVNGKWQYDPPPSATTPAPNPTSFADGNALADYLMKYRGQVSSKDRAKFDQYVAQIRGMGAFPQQGEAQPGGNPNTPQGLQARRDDFIARFKASPLYQTNYNSMMEEATKGVQRNSSAAGMLNSGRTLKALQDRAGDISSRLYGSYEGGLWNMAGWQQPTPASSGVSSAIMGQAQPANFGNAAGIAGIGNAVNNALGSFGYLQGLRSSSAYPSTTKTQDRL